MLSYITPTLQAYWLHWPLHWPVPRSDLTPDCLSLPCNPLLGLRLRRMPSAPNSHGEDAAKAMLGVRKATRELLDVRAIRLEPTTDGPSSTHTPP